MTRALHAADVQTGRVQLDARGHVRAAPKRGRPGAAKAPTPRRPARAVAGRSRAVLLDSGDGVRVPVATPNPSNGSHGHWARSSATARRVRATVLAGCALLPPALRTAAAWIVVLERHGRGVLDTDNLGTALKHARDAAAAWLGIDDADPRVRWAYRQRRAATPAVVVRVVALRPSTPGAEAWADAAYAVWASARPSFTGPGWMAHAHVGAPQACVGASHAGAVHDGLRDEASARRVALDLLAALVGVAGEEG